MLNMAAHEDDLYIRLLKEGDEKAFSVFYDALWERVFKYVLAILHEPDDAVDVVQDTFVSLWQQRKELSEITSIEHFVFSIAKYKALRYIRRNIRTRNYLASLSGFQPNDTSNIDDRIDAADMLHIVDAEVGALPAKMRAIFLLSRTQNLSHKEIAHQLQISEKTVKKQINNVLRILRKKVRNSFLLAVILLLQ